MAAPIVFFDIAGPDLAAQRDFYAQVFDWASTRTDVLTRRSRRRSWARFGPIPPTRCSISAFPT